MQWSSVSKLISLVNLLKLNQLMREEKVERDRVAREATFNGENRQIFGCEGSQEVPACHSEKGAEKDFWEW